MEGSLEERSESRRSIWNLWPKTSSAERCICNCGRDWWKILHRCDKCRMQTDRQSFNKVNVETHILDFSGDLYGYELKVSFYSFIRPEQRFSSVEMLKEQMERDIETSRSRMMSINGDM